MQAESRPNPLPETPHKKKSLNPEREETAQVKAWRKQLEAWLQQTSVTPDRVTPQVSRYRRIPCGENDRSCIQVSYVPRIDFDQFELIAEGPDFADLPNAISSPIEEGEGEEKKLNKDRMVHIEMLLGNDNTEGFAALFERCKQLIQLQSS